MNKTITMIVAPDGKTKIETHGYTGSDCRDATRFLEDAIGVGTVERLKHEYFVEDRHNSNQEKDLQC